MTLSDLAENNRKPPPPAPPPDSSSTLPLVHDQELYNVRGVQAPPSMERCASNTSTFSFGQDMCRICHCEGDTDSPLVAPCYCSGSLRYVHQSCLQQWIKSSDTKSCELCKFNFIMHSKIKPFSKWEKLDMSGKERRKIACTVTFHVVALVTVVWALYVLIERSIEEVKKGTLEWPLWTKVIVVAIAFTGGLVYMYVQCKIYVQLCRRWRAFNRVIYVQNAPEKVPLSERDRAELQREAGQLCGGGCKDSCSESHESEKSVMGVSIITSATAASHDLNPITTLTTTPTPLTARTHFTSTPIASITPPTHAATSPTPPGAVWTEPPPPYNPAFPCSAPGVLSGTRRSRSTSQQPSSILLTKGPNDSLPGTREEDRHDYEGRCNHGSMEELSSQALASTDRQPFRKSSTHSMCLEKGMERSMAGESVTSHQERIFDVNTPLWDGQVASSQPRRAGESRVEPRMIHTPSLSQQCRTEGGAEAHEVETLTLDTM